VRNCAKCIIFKKAKNIEEASIKEDDEDEIEDDGNNDSNASEQDNDTIEHEQKPVQSNIFQLVKWCAEV